MAGCVPRHHSAHAHRLATSKVGIMSLSKDVTKSFGHMRRPSNHKINQHNMSAGMHQKRCTWAGQHLWEGDLFFHANVFNSLWVCTFGLFCMCASPAVLPPALLATTHRPFPPPIKANGPQACKNRTATIVHAQKDTVRLIRGAVKHACNVVLPHLVGFLCCVPHMQHVMCFNKSA